MNCICYCGVAFHATNAIFHDLPEMSGSAVIFVSKVGVICPLGDSLPKVVAAVSAGISRYRKSGVYLRSHQEVSLAKVPDACIEVELAKLITLGKSVRFRRIVALLANALMQLAPSLSPNVEIMLMLTLPENFPGYVSDLNRDVLRELAALTGLNINLTESVVFTVGAAGGGLALAASIEKLKNIKMNTCVIMAGADSCIDLSLLAQLDKARRLANLDALDSFVPGEGACALLLSAEANPSSLGAVSCLENGIEDGHRFASDTAYRGDGLARTMSRSLTLYAGANKPAIIYSNLNGESFGLKELGVATIRNSQHLANPWRQEHPADGYGDQGGASFPLLIAIALANKAAPALVLCSSWGAERCCVLVEAPRA